MANSDNVVRAGLTPKFRDVDVLVDMLTYATGPAEVMAAQAHGANVTKFCPPVPEFEMFVVDVPAGAEGAAGVATLPVAHNGPWLWIVVSGSASASLGGGASGTEPSEWCARDVYYVPPACELVLTAGKEGMKAFGSRCPAK